jgi:hypothetical protein
MSILGNIIGTVTQPIADGVKSYLEIRSRERLRKIELEEAIHQRRVELIKEGLAADAAWELEQIRNSGWKDEYVLLVLSIPLVGCFIPAYSGYVLQGFNVLSQTPEWFQWLVLAVFTAIYGIRLFRRQQSDT